jgi:predicted transcriptional regulator
MTGYKLQNLRSLHDEMKAVARGEILAPADAGKPSFNSIDALVRLLTPDNRHLLAMIRGVGAVVGACTAEPHSDAGEAGGGRVHHDDA